MFWCGGPNSGREVSPLRSERKMISQREDQQKGDQPVQSAPEWISDRTVSSRTPELVDEDYPMNTAS